MLEDLTLEEKNQNKMNEDLKWLRSTLETISRALAYDGRQLYAQLSRYPSSCKLRQSLNDVLVKPPVLSLIPTQLEDSSVGGKTFFH